MRILMLNNEFPPLGGGTGTVNLSLLRQFERYINLEIILITSELGKKTTIEQFSEAISIHKVPVSNQNIHHSSNRELLIYACRAFLLAIRLNQKKHFDLCFAWSSVPAGGVAFLLKRFFGLKYLVRVCGPDIPGFEQRYAFIYSLLKPFIKVVWSSAEVVVAKCRGEADMIQEILPDIHIELIPNGVDTLSFKPSQVKRRSGPLRLLCVARLIDRKGQRYLIQAVHQLVRDGHPVTLDLIGIGDSENDYRSLVKELGVENHVRFLGYIPRDEIPQHYSKADVFVLSSYNEGMSLATLEAMASGLPVIVTRVGGMDELVEEGVNGYFTEWADVGGIVSVINKLIKERELVESMGTASRLHAMKFSWDGAAKLYEALFLKLQTSE